MRFIAFALVALALVATAETAQANDFVVVKAEGMPEFSLGDIVDSGSKLTVPEGGKITFIDGSGKKILVAGPYEGSLVRHEANHTGTRTQSGTRPLGLGVKVNVVGALARLFKDNVLASTRLGAFRSIGGVQTISNPGVIDVASAGHFCFDAGQTLPLWRAKQGDPETVHLANTKTGEKAQVRWAKGEAMADWPLEVPFADGAVYETSTGNAKAKTLILHKLPSDLPTRVHKAAWMAENKCDQQAMLLVVSADVDKLLDALSQEGKF